jgi:hypothetical protein
LLSHGEKTTQQTNDKVRDGELLRSLNTFENEGNPTKTNAFPQFLLSPPLNRH